MMYALYVNVDGIKSKPKFFLTRKSFLKYYNYVKENIKYTSLCTIPIELSIGGIMHRIENIINYGRL